MNKLIPFNKPFVSGDETKNLSLLIDEGEGVAGDQFLNLCYHLLSSKFGFHNCFLTTSCTSALEMAALLAGIKEGDEVIIPSYTFSSTANAFILRGAKVVFCDSKSNHPSIFEDKIEGLITPKTKVIVPVHYGGFACDMERIMAIAEKHNLLVIEDAAQALNSFVILKSGKRKSVGTFGHFSAFSFHHTKNITCGEGGLIVINDKSFLEKAKVIRNNGTNKTLFQEGKVDKYDWVGVGSSFLLSEINAAYLFAQLNKIDSVDQKRKTLWDLYYLKLSQNKLVVIPPLFTYSTNNYHIFYMVCSSGVERDNLISFLKEKNIQAVFHYQSLHQSPYFESEYTGSELVNSDVFSERLVRLPLYCDLSEEEAGYISDCILTFYSN